MRHKKKGNQNTPLEARDEEKRWSKGRRKEKQEHQEEIQTKKKRDRGRTTSPPPPPIVCDLYRLTGDNKTAQEEGVSPPKCR